MSTNLQLYTLASVYIDGSLLAEETSVAIGRDTKAQEVETVAKGFAGMSPGSAQLSISVDSGVPSADFELDPGKFMKGLKVCEVTVFAGGRTLTSKGFITKDNFKHGVNSPSGLSFEFIGQYADWV